MKKVGILTFYWADDLGAMLQAYAMKSCLADLGYDSEIIPYSKLDFTGRYWLWPYLSIDSKTCRRLGKMQYSLFKRNVKRLKMHIVKRCRMKKYRRQFLTKAMACRNEKLLKLTDYDAIVIGSDQVWNPELTVGLDKFYFGNFERKAGCKVISYAASMGKEALSPEEGRLIGEYLDRNFDAVSLREKSSIPFINSVTEKIAIDVPDPTILCTVEMWKSIAEKSCVRPKKGYVVYHRTEDNREMLRYARNLAEREGHELVDIRDVIPTGPLEFLKYISQAEYVVTNSFHGTVFSVLFEKPMAVFSHRDKNARLYDLMDNLGLTDRLSTEHEIEDIMKPIDWAGVRRRIESGRAIGIQFLRDSIEGNFNKESE